MGSLRAKINADRKSYARSFSRSYQQYECGDPARYDFWCALFQLIAAGMMIPPSLRADDFSGRRRSSGCSSLFTGSSWPVRSQLPQLLLAGGPVPAYPACSSLRAGSSWPDPAYKSQLIQLFQLILQGAGRFYYLLADMGGVLWDKAPTERWDVTLS